MSDKSFIQNLTMKSLLSIDGGNLNSSLDIKSRDDKDNEFRMISGNPIKKSRYEKIDVKDIPENVIDNPNYEKESEVSDIDSSNGSIINSPKTTIRKIQSTPKVIQNKDLSTSRLEKQPDENLMIKFKTLEYEKTKQAKKIEELENICMQKSEDVRNIKNQLYEDNRKFDKLIKDKDLEIQELTNYKYKISNELEFVNQLNEKSRREVSEIASLNQKLELEKHKFLEDRNTNYIFKDIYQKDIDGLNSRIKEINDELLREKLDNSRKSEEIENVKNKYSRNTEKFFKDQEEYDSVEINETRIKTQSGSTINSSKIIQKSKSNLIETHSPTEEIFLNQENQKSNKEIDLKPSEKNKPTDRKEQETQASVQKLESDQEFINLNSELENLRILISEKEFNLETLKQSLNQASSDLFEEKSENKKKTEKLLETNSKLEETKKEISSITQETQKLIYLNESLTKENLQVAEKYAKLKSESESQRLLIDETIEELKKFKEENTKLSENLYSVQIQNQNYNNEVINLKTELDKAERQVLECTQAIQASKEDLRKVLISEKNEKELISKRYEVEIKELSELLSNQASELRFNESELNRLQSLNESLQATIQENDKKIEEITAELASVIQSSKRASFNHQKEIKQFEIDLEITNKENIDQRIFYEDEYNKLIYINKNLAIESKKKENLYNNTLSELKSEIGLKNKEILKLKENNNQLNYRIQDLEKFFSKQNEEKRRTQEKRKITAYDILELEKLRANDENEYLKSLLSDQDYMIKGMEHRSNLNVAKNSDLIQNLNKISIKRYNLFKIKYQELQLYINNVVQAQKDLFGLIKQIEYTLIEIKHKDYTFLLYLSIVFLLLIVFVKFFRFLP